MRTLFIIGMAFILFTACGGAQMDGTGTNPDDGNSDENTLPATVFETCQVDELLVGTWYVQTAIDGDDVLQIDNIFSFAPDGSFQATTRQYYEGIYLTLDGSYEVLSSDTIHMTYTVAKEGRGVNSTETFDEDVLYYLADDEARLQLQFPDSTFYDLQKKPDDEDFFTAGTDGRERDGICGTNILTTCPAEEIVARWELAPYYFLVYSNYIVSLSNARGLDDFDSIIFYSTGTVKTLKDSEIVETLDYEIAPCSDTDCSDSDWYLSFTWAEYDATGSLLINMSEDSLAIYPEDKDPPVIIFTKMYDLSLTGEVGCSDE
ncbi:MAG: hypothetical protein HYU99_08780 [Deltaproteobacteria bacterium]|nr:hypothetical protein [Deltaproteobacteria bacterium]